MKNNIGLLSLVFLVFLVLKLTGHIAWSWWWVTAPLWGLFGVMLAVLALASLVCGVLVMWERRPWARR